ncbi:MAG: aspartate carbamoyltransferase regulatory subunit [Tissierellia bacterium]|nr:aspartate carbamoyltransferase regulatory subunit [Tissierellia bacterium]
MLKVDSISRGIVIDHIEAGHAMCIYKYLELHNADYVVAMIMNVPSKKMGRKDLIKIENNIDMDLNILGVIAPNITVNIIENEEIIEKKQIELPQTFEGVISCKNPRCVTTDEKHITQRFTLIDENVGKYKCVYCDTVYEWED